ncbi:MAG: hypothetical protein KDI55_00365 [Anaerolineae bacterium]|nr:hypothetical protein [Anaerolineae bacterium]
MDSKSLDATESVAAEGATSPRVSLMDIRNEIKSKTFLNLAAAIEASGIIAPEAAKIMTLCVVEMHNGFIFIGKSAPASPENYDAEKGKLFAGDDAVRQIWPMMGFALKDRLKSSANV